jgi:hypothetical protein
MIATLTPIILVYEIINFKHDLLYLKVTLYFHIIQLPFYYMLQLLKFQIQSYQHESIDHYNKFVHKIFSYFSFYKLQYILITHYFLNVYICMTNASFNNDY